MPIPVLVRRYFAGRIVYKLPLGQLFDNALLTRLSCLLRFNEGSIKKEKIVDFLKALKAQFK